MHKKILFLLVGILSLFPSVHADEDTTIPTLDYVRITSDGVYHLYGSNIPTDSARVNVYVDGKKIDKSSIVLTKDGADIGNLSRTAGTFMIERLKGDYSIPGTITYSVDKTTGTITIRNNQNIAFNGKILRENKSGYDVITVPFVTTLPGDSTNSQNELLTNRKLLLNGQEKALIPFMGEYKDDVYYYTTSGITFVEKNLTERINTLALKIDGLLSNYVSIRKEGIILDSPTHVTIEDLGMTKNIKVVFSAPQNFNNLTGKEVYVNGTKIDNSGATIGLGQLVIAYDMSKLAKDQDTLSIILKDTSNNTFSNEQIISVANYSQLLITSVDTGKGDNPLFTFVIKGNMNALFGDIYKFKININGTGYTRDGTKEYIKDASGAIDKDSYGNDRYELKNKLEFRKTEAGLEFEFGYNNLKDEGNIIYLINDNTGRESNKVLFFKQNSRPADYSYLTGATLGEGQKKESFTFDIGKDFEKKINPTNMTASDRDISLGKLNFTNLKSNEYYNVSFVINTDLSVNPFSSVVFGTANLEAIKNEDNTISFAFKKQGFGKDFTASTELTAALNELYNASDTAFHLIIKKITLEKLTTKNSFETIFSITNPLKSSLSYLYNKSTCFDGAKDFCSIIKESDPLLIIQHSASGAPIKTDVAEAVIPVTTTTGTGSNIGKKNITTIVTQSFENEKFKKVQTILITKYKALKKKGSVYIPTFRKAINTFLLGLRNYELNINRTESIVQVKTALGTINEVLRKAKKE